MNMTNPIASLPEETKVALVGLVLSITSVSPRNTYLPGSVEHYAFVSGRESMKLDIWAAIMKGGE